MSEPRVAYLTLIYGDPGVGKSVNTIMCAPNSLFIGEYSAIMAPAKSVCGIDIDPANIIVPDDLDQATQIISEIGAGKRKLANGQPVESVVIDDLSLLALRQFDKLQVDPTMQGRGAPDHFKVQNAFTSKILKQRDTARRANVTVLVSGHMGTQHVNQLTGQTIKGGVKLRGQIQADIGQAYDQVLLCVRDASRWPIGHPVSFCVDADDSFVTKDRLNVVAGYMPFNLGEIFRFRGLTFSRFAGMSWMDEAVDKYSQAINGALNDAQLMDRNTVLGITSQLRKDIEAKYTKIVAHQNWCIQDAYHRVLIARLVSKRSNSLWG